MKTSYFNPSNIKIPDKLIILEFLGIFIESVFDLVIKDNIFCIRDQTFEIQIKFFVNIYKI
jgi:hypothetical protein